MQEETDELARELKNAIDIIKEHCLNVKNGIQLGTELAIDQINKTNESMIAQVDEYEKSCIKHIENGLVEEKDFLKLIDEMNAFCSEWKPYLLRFRIDESEMKRANKEALGAIMKLDANRKKLQRIAFREKMLSFQVAPLENFPIIFGSLDTEILSISFNDLNDSVCLSVNNINAFSKIDCFHFVKHGEKANFLLTYILQDNCRKALSFDAVN